MPSLKFVSLCVATLVSTSANAFVVLPSTSSIISSNSQLFAVDVPTTATVTAVTAKKGNAQGMTTIQTQTSSSNLPSQKELLGKAGTNTLAAAPPASTKSTNIASGSGINIADIHYDGIVPKTEADEYIVISNASKNPIDVTGYFIYPANTGTQGSTFYFPKGSVIKGGSSVRVYTNEIHKESGGYSWGNGKALWSNNGGLGVLKDASGKKLGEYKYKPPKSA
mmetsp:Transcript_20956/g.20155  ORF Transcript_20956/g.20155 Transcript_20956/m.20155 type:complete len:223 (-) Transcript_20956:400-1068(-)|eukprot:CAMPEP_0197827712 /NCGR_PEP_ID=MMETSP1437-20131217/4446_1 /TAXON_ID=49252 ORGANISM="Eucampia antarctica, Strain CCMP1452" /NCGR_SAMPLE_ID=MMETSP1437 /ASSEMBLY_ACC=CAM_ASM_001096 /LENGTH=222 /DNA_ID=CAMNT_0043428685 /DNA_START=37 /DNA_END=705 /DNA_ORIENTATION=+